MVYGFKVSRTINYIYIDEVNGDDNNTGTIVTSPVRTFLAAIERAASNRSNYFMLMSDINVDTTNFYSINEATLSISIIGYDGVNFTPRTINLSGNERMVSSYGELMIRFYKINIVEDVARAASSVLYSTMGITLYMEDSNHLNAATPLLSSGVLTRSYFTNSQLTPGKIFRNVLAGDDPTWRYKNSNLTTG